MTGIEIMVQEHRYIERMLQVVRKACYGIMKGEPLCVSDFEAIISFIRNYADDHHHGKEEKFLFNRMIDEIGGPAEKLVKFGMLIEHDLGRLYIQELEKAIEAVVAGDDEARLDVIAHAMGYTHLLARHIGKEDEVAYTFAQHQLSDKTLQEIDEACYLFEERQEGKGVQKYYITLLESLEEKYVGA